MKWLLTLALIADCVYQGFGYPMSVNWSIYYDLTHYMFLFGIALWSVFKLYEMRYLAWIFIIYFFGVSFNIMMHINEDLVNYWKSKLNNDGLICWSVFALITLTLITIIIKLNDRKRKRNEKITG